MWSVLLVTVCATVIALLSPRWYMAAASVFPAEQADPLSCIGGLSSLVKTFTPNGKLSALTDPTEPDRYPATLKSETALSEVIDHFDLTNVYEIQNYPRGKTMKRLLSNVDFVVEPEGDLDIAVYDRDPARAAAMCSKDDQWNLRKENTEKCRTQGRRRRTSPSWRR